MCSKFKVSSSYICRAPFDAPHLATASSGGVLMYQCVDDQLRLVAGLDQKEISLSLDWTLHKCVPIATVLLW